MSNTKATLLVENTQHTTSPPPTLPLLLGRGHREAPPEVPGPVPAVLDAEGRRLLRQAGHLVQRDAVVSVV